MISDEAYYKVAQHSEYQALDELWAVTKYPADFDFSDKYSPTYKSRIKLFCCIIQRLLKENKMRLAYGGAFLKGTPEEQANRFSLAFPKNQEDFDSTIWFLTEECPGGAVWYTDIDDHGFQTTPVGDGRFYYWT